jgi:hypothetical protein
MPSGFIRVWEDTAAWARDIRGRFLRDTHGEVHYAVDKITDAVDTQLPVRPGYAGPTQGWENIKPSDLTMLEPAPTLQEIIQRRDYDREGFLFGMPPNDPRKGTRKYMYVIDESGTIRLGRADLDFPYSHHPDLIQGANAYGAGELYMDRAGNIVWIDELSGHYTPNAMEFFPYLKHLLTLQGISLSEEVFNCRLC